MPQIYFIADTHFGHRSIINMCARPFDDIEQHDRALVEAWNATVRPGDVVYHLGDFAYRAGPQRTQQIFDQLNGEKHLVLGNHDHKGVTKQLGWASQHELTEIVVDGQALVLCHYSLRVWRNMRRGAIQLYGHSHGNLPGTGQSIDVGVDVMGYRPVTLPEIRARLAELPPLEFKDDSDVVDAIEVQPAPPV